jgi:hypothetical protein
MKRDTMEFRILCYAISYQISRRVAHSSIYLHDKAPQVSILRPRIDSFWDGQIWGTRP